MPEVDEVLPLRPVDFLVLIVLADEERHGYGIVQDIAEQSQGKIRLVPGNLYSVLRRLIGVGVIEEANRRKAVDLNDARRRYYRITAFGRQVVRAEAARLRDLVGIAEARRLLDRAEPVQ